MALPRWRASSVARLFLILPVFMQQPQPGELCSRSEQTAVQQQGLRDGALALPAPRAPAHSAHAFKCSPARSQAAAPAATTRS